MSEQAGAIAFKLVDDEAWVMLVRARKTPADWIFPKGHIEAGETAEFAAERELAEEAGVHGKSVGLVGRLAFRSGQSDVTVAYYLVLFVAEVQREEKRERKWCTYEEALSKLSHPAAADLLRTALPMIKEHLPRY